MDYFYRKPELIPLQLGTEYAQQAVKDLGVWGSDALFGLLWRYSFDFTCPIRKSVLSQPAIQLSLDQNTNHQLSMAIHSRHVYPTDTGCNVTLEQNGIMDILQQHRQTASTPANQRSSCRVTILSDRSCTIERLTNWLNETTTCRAVVMPHETVKSKIKEHGPFTRAGFLQDMLLASLTARDGMVGSLEPSDGTRWRSSSELVEEAMAYHRTMSYFASGQDPRQLKTLYWSTIGREGPTAGLVP